MDYDLDDLNTDDDNSSGDSNPVKELRAQNRRLAKELKEAKAASEDLIKFKTEYESQQKASTASKVFTDLGLPEAQAKAFVKLYPESEVNAETVKAYALEYGLAVTGEPAPEEKTDSFRPVSAAGSSPVKGTLKYEEYQNLLETNPTAALQAVAENRVEGMLSTPRH